MPYATTTYADLQTQLSSRLGDSSQIFWTAPEIRIHITEALRTFGLCSGFWRDRGTFSTTPATAFYDLRTLLSNGAELLLSSNVTDRDIIIQILYNLLEVPTNGSSYSGTEMFTYSDISSAVQHRLNQFLSDTGTVVTRSLVTSTLPTSGRETLAETTIDVRRVAWLGASPINYYKTLWREDERLLTAAGSSWSVTPATPDCFSILAPPPLKLQLAPPAVAAGQLELLTVDSTTLNPSSSATTLGIPDDLTPAIRWGALADLLGIDGIASDPVRAAFCEARYRQYVNLARLLPVVIHAELNGVPLTPCTLQELDSSTPNWENQRGTPSDIALAAPNLVALSKVPSAVSSVVLDVVRRTPIPAGGGDFIQLGQEQLDMILDYAEHLALLKVGGAEWRATERQSANFLTQCITYNQRLSASARASFSAGIQSQRQKDGIPRRVDGWLRQNWGVGAVKVSEE